MTRPIDAADPILPEFPRRSPESPELWLVQLFGALVLHAVLLLGVRLMWAEITIESPQAGAIDFVEVGTVDQVNEGEVQPDKAEGVAPTQPAPVAQQPQTTLQQPEPEPIAQVSPSPEPVVSSSPIVEQPSPTPIVKPSINPPSTAPLTGVPTPQPTSTNSPPLTSASPQPTSPAAPRPTPTKIAGVPQTEDRKTPDDIAGAPPNTLQTQGFGSIIKPNLSPLSQRELNATSATLSIDPLPPRTVPEALGINSDINFQVNVSFALSDDRLLPGSVNLSAAQSTFVKNLPPAALRSFIESILVNAQFRVEIQTATGAASGSASSWNAIVEIQVSTPGG
jgi:outer membrane biosynthesis protein TonB